MEDKEYRDKIKTIKLGEYPKYPLQDYLKDFPNLEKIYDYKGIIIYERRF